VSEDASQAIEGVHPAESLNAASVLFETALPFVLRALSAVGRPDAEARAVLVLHRLIMSRIASSAILYTEFMLKTIRDLHRAELARLARDLHDHAAHAIGVAIQNLELHEVHARRDVAQAQEKLHRAQEAMRQALDSVRHLSVELRTTVRPDELEQALTEYLVANAESNVLTSVKATGDTAMLPGQVCEEVYVTLREAIRNALVHSGTTRLDVTVGISESQLHARVSDAGRGFTVEEATKTGEGIGLSSMRERVQLLGGTLRLSSLLGHGTTVDISIPLGRVLL
jgi:signal transduction histidine kinase